MGDDGTLGKPAASGTTAPVTGAPNLPAAAPPASQGRAADRPATCAKDAPRDVVLLGPPTADGGGVHVIRARDERIETGELRALEEGRPIHGEVVTLKPRKDNPRVCDVQESFAARGAPDARATEARSHKGPARVSTQRYRDGWDEIFGAKPDADPKKTLN